MAVAHERLDIYERAADVAAKLHHIANRVPARRGDLRTQLHRCSLSIPLNIAEGAGEFSPAAKANFYRIARRSATECMSALDIMGRIEGDRDRYHDVLEDLRAIAVGLSALAIAMERRANEASALASASAPG